MKHLPLTASDAEIRTLVVDWHELLAAKRYDAALALFLHVDRDGPWTADGLAATIAGYGVPDIDADTLADLHAEFEVSSFEFTPLDSRPDKGDVVADIRVDRQRLYGLDPARYLGMVHYRGVPLSGQRSDLTARFHILRVGDDRLSLEFLDLHVM